MKEVISVTWGDLEGESNDPPLWGCGRGGQALGIGSFQSICVAATEHCTSQEASGNMGIKALVTEQRSPVCSDGSLSRTATFPNPSIFGVKPIL